ncbi:tRNA (guanosine(46)-N7)-methyltransferase TrmB [Hyphomonas sp.]|jgi:tRNA (guanine-N7-)-methyltransferase|uniref:tRNA (guanosine(46)-N7)-methyltransferase TrmB n=1 Tax=Hyphomonas sp. TaxID=87 RepID=UPI0037BF61AF
MSAPEQDGLRDRPIRTFGRTGGRPLSPRQKQLIETRLGHWRLPQPAARDFQPLSLFPSARAVWLEIGFGGGEHLVAQAAANPDTGFIGCEPFVEGVAKAIGGIEDNGLANVRLWPDDARLLLEAFAPACIARVFILFPDPWPKRRQQKRRLVQPDFVAALARILAPGGRLRFATDVASYADEALLAFEGNDAFQWTATRADDWRCPPADHVTTRYESKKLGDCAPVWYDFLRI